MIRDFCTLMISKDAPHFGSVNLPPTSSAKFPRLIAVVNLLPHSEHTMFAITWPPSSGGRFVACFVCFGFLLLNLDARPGLLRLIYLMRPRKPLAFSDKAMPGYRF